MKNKICLFLILFIFPLFVLADEISLYKNLNSFVSNPNGAYLYEYNESSKTFNRTTQKLNANDEVKISKEKKILGNLYYGEVCVNSGDESCTTYYIKLSDVSVKNASELYKPSDYEKDYKIVYSKSKISDIHVKKKVLVVLDNVSLYNGPSLKYDVVKSLEKNKVYNASAVVDDWYYIIDGEDKGWVNITTGVAKSVPSETREANTGFEIYDGIDGKVEYTTQTIININLLYKYEDTDKNNVWYYIKYNDTNGYIKEGNNSIAKNTLLITKEIPYYDLVGEKSVGTIPSSAVFNYVGNVKEVNDNTRSYFYVYYIDKYCWIEESSDTKHIELKSKQFINIKDMPLYEIIGNKEVGKLPFGIIHNYLMYYDKVIDEKTTERYYLVEYKDKNYWIKYNDDFKEIIEGEGKVLTFDTTYVHEISGGEQKDKLAHNMVYDFHLYYDTFTNGIKERHYYIDYDEGKYWVSSNTVVEDTYIIKFKLANEVYLYDKPGGRNSIINVPKGVEFTNDYKYVDGAITWYYIDNNIYKGWVRQPQFASFSEQVKPGRVELFETIHNNESTGSSSSTIIIIVIIVVVLVALGAGVFIFLKKKKKKNIDNSVADPFIIKELDNNDEQVQNGSPMSDNVNTVNQSSPMREEEPVVNENIGVDKNEENN